jgi:hypothetical protein
MSQDYFNWFDARFDQVLRLVQTGELSVIEGQMFFTEELRASYRYGFEAGEAASSRQFRSNLRK